MGIIKKQSIQNTIISYAGIILGFITTILLYPSILEPEQYGLTRLMLSVSFVFSQIAHLGMKNIIIRYFPYFEDEKKDHNGFFFLTIIIPLLGFFLFLIIFVLFRQQIVGYYQEESALFVRYIWYIVPLVFFSLYFEIMNNYIRARFNSIPGSLANEVVLRIVTIILLAVYFFGFLDFRQFIIAFVFSYAVPPLLMLSYLIRTGDVNLRPNFSFLSKSLIRSMSTYGMYALLGGITTLLVSNIDIIMLGLLAGLTNTAVYAIAFYIGSVISVPQRSISKIANPLLAKYLKENNLSEIENIYKRSSLNQLIGGCLFYIGIWANMDNILHILPPEYLQARWVILTIGLAKLFDMATGINGGIILNSEYYRFDLYANILLVLLSIFTNYLLIPALGILGAAIATALSLFLYNLVKYIFVWLKFSMQPFRWSALGVLAVSAGILLCALQIPLMINIYVDIILRSAIILVLFTGLVYFFHLSDDVNSLIRNILWKTKQWIKSGPENHT